MSDSNSPDCRSSKWMSPEEFPRTWKAAVEFLRLRQTSALAIGFWQKKRPGTMHALALGQTRWLPDEGRPVDCQTWFDWASITKLLSATLFARLVDRGWVDWKTPVASLLPEFPRDLEFSHLLSHSGGYPAVAPFYREIASAFYPRPLHEVSTVDRQRWVRERLARASRLSLPGERVLYSDYSFLVLGIALERLMGGVPLRDLFESYLLSPLQLQEIGFFSPKAALLQSQELNVAATEICHFRGGLIQGEVHDENAWVLGGLAAHAGAFGSIGGLLGFGARLLLGHGMSERVREEMWAPIQIRGELQGRTLGWDTASGEQSSAGKYFSDKQNENTVGHLGFTGTSLWLDRKREIAVGLLTNRIHPSRNSEGIRNLRIRMHEALAEDLGI